ncbi:DNA-binding response regulator, NarL/FixJ family, contains REC and HTH domains [Parafrankia irregularis]|uniref:DNA-binding response regulator, NarL/FixJ family, contains REC and HTH domains n=1 Tax=Parafrankia irregularis TaxID=795642 RepID=A0A0S4QTH7_9ACTN|nr:MULTISPECIES: response regulator transcription factor [Parafrankia]MBE3205912.1 response regulator transcription factor [Parafrankia sp. CH37]CUU58140.1 DNA-binding response regulator, NarL/FixJ family, contains REC and HTH domains [Parafrankia irregularis]
MRVVIAEDNGLLLDTLSTALRQRGVDVVGLAGSLPEVLQAVDRRRPDVVVLDIHLPPTLTDEGIRAAEQIRAAHPGIGLLVLSEHAEAVYAERLLGLQDDTQAIGYLLKARVATLSGLVDALEQVHQGGIVIDPAVVRRLLDRRRRDNPLDRLTPHEQRVLSLVAEGRANRGVAAALGCSVATVEKHLSAITAKLQLRGADDPGHLNLRVLAVLTYLRNTTTEARPGQGQRVPPPTTV